MTTRKVSENKEKHHSDAQGHLVPHCVCSSDAQGDLAPQCVCPSDAQGHLINVNLKMYTFDDIKMYNFAMTHHNISIQ